MKEERTQVLIIEDEAALRNALRDKLTNAGFSVTTAKDGEEGLVLAFAEEPQLILLDVVMPKMDGMTLLHKLRKDSWGQTVPVIMLTNLEANIPSNAVFEYLVKSNTHLEDVVAKVKAKLGVANVRAV